MILVYIEDKLLLKKIVNYLDNADLVYTTDFSMNYESILISGITPKTLDIVTNAYRNNKKVYFITYNEEKRLEKKLNNNIKYKDLLLKILDKCYLIITSLPYYKKLLLKYLKKDIVVINEQIPTLPDLKKAKITKKNKCIIIIDHNYDNLEIINKLSKQYINYNYIYIGYKPDYLLNKNKRSILRENSNIKFVRYIEFLDFYKLINSGYLVIDFNDDINEINTIILLKSKLLLKNSNKWDNYFIHNKNIYLFNDDNLDRNFKKIIDEKWCDITYESYKFIKDNNFSNIVQKFNQYLK